MTARGGAIRGGALGVLFASTVASCSLVRSFDGFITEPGADEDAAIADDASRDAPSTDVSVASEASADAARDAQPDVFMTPYRSAVFADRPIAYFPLDEPSGSNVVYDVVGGIEGTVRQGVLLGETGVAGTGSARFFGDVTGWISVPPQHFNFVGGNPFSFELWARPLLKDARYNNALTKTAALNGYSSYFRRDGTVSSATFHVGSPDAGATAGGLLTFDAGADADMSPDASVDPGWLHVVCTFDGLSMTLYVNGAPLGGAATTHPPEQVNDFLRIGFAFLGHIDEVALYDHALSTGRVGAHYASR